MICAIINNHFYSHKTQLSLTPELIILFGDSPDEIILLFFIQILYLLVIKDIIIAIYVIINAYFNCQ